MNDLFTIASIVIAVSGATYSALVGIRTLLTDRVDKIWGQSETDIADIRGSSQEAIKIIAEKKFRRLRRWRRIWVSSYAVPIILFTLAAFGLAIHVCWVYWDSPVDPPSDPPNYWRFYRWVIVLLTTLDALCLALKGIAYRGIRGNGEDLSDNYATFVDLAQTLERRQESS